MRYTHDWEFLDTGFAGIMPISVGIVGEDGREYYAVNSDISMDRILRHDFLRSEVLPHLPMVPMPEGARGEQYILDRTDPSVKPLAQIAEEIPAFLLAPGTPVELWAFYSAHDHYCMASLNGRMVDSTPGVPWFTRDIKSEAVRLGNPPFAEQDPDTAHHALHDARHDWTMLRTLWTVEKIQRDTREGRVPGRCPACGRADALAYTDLHQAAVSCLCGWQGSVSQAASA